MLEITTVTGRKYLVNALGQCDGKNLLGIIPVRGIGFWPTAKIDQAWIDTHQPLYCRGARYRMRFEQDGVISEERDGIRLMRMLAPAKLAS